MYLHEVIEDMHQGINTVADKVVYQETGIPIIQSKNFTKGFLDLEDVRYLGVEDEEEYSSKYNPHVGDILMANIGTIGKSYVIKEEQRFLIAWNAFLIKPKKECICPDFLKYYFDYLATSNYFDKLLTGGTVKFINKKKIGEILIPNCSMKEQTEIVQVLSKIEQVIIKRQQQLEMLDNFIKSRFMEMFGDPVTNPRGWSVERLGDLTIQINSGNTPKGGEQVYVEKGITFFRSQNVWKDRLEMGDIAYIDEETHKNMSRSSLKHGDILMTKTGRINTENSSLGRAALYLGEDDAANVNGHVYFIRLKPGVNNKFVLRILVSNEYRDYIRSVCVGGIDKRQLNKEHIEDFPIVCPPEDMISEYVAFVDQVTKLKFEVQKSLDEMQTLMDSLMQQYFG